MNYDSGSDVEEVKMTDDLKAKFEEKQKKINSLNKKRNRNAKRNLVEKYKTEINLDLDLENKSQLNLIKKQKVKNFEESDDENTNMFEKDDFVLKVLEQKFNKVDKEVLDFRRNHFFGGRVKRSKINKILLSK